MVWELLGDHLEGLLTVLTPNPGWLALASLDILSTVTAEAAMPPQLQMYQLAGAQPHSKVQPGSERSATVRMLLNLVHRRILHGAPG